MTVNMTQEAGKAPRNRKGAPGRRVVLLARMAIFIERAAPIAMLAGAPLAALAIASLYDAWSATPRWAHGLALIAGAALAVSLGYRFRRRDLWPTRSEALARLEADGGVRHDALQTLEDRSFAGAGPLWEAHVADMREKAGAARLTPPRATANAVDPYGLRYAALALFAVGWIGAGGQAGHRLLRGVLPSDPRAAAPGFADLWIEPPAYTAKAPIYLLRAGDKLPGARAEISAPEGSVVKAQVNQRSRFRLSMRTIGGRAVAEKGADGNPSRATLTLTQGGVLSLRAGGREGRWPINIIDDRAPEVDFIEPPNADEDGRLVLSARINDDYGVAAATLRMRLDPAQARPLDAPALGDAAKAESRLIALDGFEGPLGDRAAAIDLQSDPWAGLSVIATLIVTDAAGQNGETAPADIKLPARAFFNPLARAVVEQRQTLAIAPEEWRRAEWAFSGVTLGPEYFFEKATDYLLLRTAMWRVGKEAGGDYKETVEQFWPLALQLEDESLELARRRIDAAKEALRNALEEGASDSEIERLTEEMRAAIRQYLQALAQSGQTMAQDGPPADEVVDAADLDAMLDSIRDLARAGASNAARQALADLENLLNNLQLSGRPGGDGAGEGGEPRPGGPAGEAGDLIGRQRELADKSFDRGQTRGNVGDDLGEEQGALAGDLSDLMKSLEGDADGEGDAGRAFAKALSDMRRAEEALRGEDFEAAGGAMERAIAALRDGAKALARKEGDDARAAAGEGRQPMRDPLGRPIGDAYGSGVDVPEKSDAQRTRDLIEELRRRLSDGARTEDEIKYLERLLERF